MRQPRAVMLFAAGFGTRMGHLTADRPKPLVHVAGRALIDHALDLVQDAGPLRAVANAHYRADMLRAHLEGTGVAVSLETPHILDTGGGLRAALPLLDSDPVFTMNTDAVWAGPNPLGLLSEAWDATRMDALLLCVPVAQTLGHSGEGDFRLMADGRIERGAGLVYSGTQITSTGLLDGEPDQAFSLNRIWNRMADRGRLFGLSYPGTWCDVGSPVGLDLAESMLADV